MMWAAGPVVTGYYPSANWISTLDASATLAIFLKYPI